MREAKTEEPKKDFMEAFRFFVWMATLLCDGLCLRFSDSI